MSSTISVAASLAVISAAGVPATLLRARQREAAALAAYPPQGDIVAVDGTRLHVLQAGSGPDLVLVHGSSGSIRDFTFDLMGRLARDFRVIAIDRPGLGHSAAHPRGADLAVQAGLMKSLADRLGARRPLLLGQSYGGAVALRWAVEHPAEVAGLILVSSPTHPWTTPLDPYYRVLSHPVLGRLAVPLLTAWAPRSRIEAAIADVFAPDPVPPGYIDHFGPELTLCRGPLHANAAQRRVLLPQIVAMSRHYGRLTMPVEILHGTADTIVALSIHGARLAAELPAARLTPLPGTGHMPHHTVPQAVIAAVAAARDRAGLGT